MRKLSRNLAFWWHLSRIGWRIGMKKLWPMRYAPAYVLRGLRMAGDDLLGELADDELKRRAVLDAWRRR